MFSFYRRKIANLALIFIILASFGCKSTPQKEVSIQQLIKEGRIEEAKNRFVSKYDINATDENGNTALHEAAILNEPTMISFLIAQGADPNIKNVTEGRTALHVAVKHNSTESVEELIADGSNIFICDNDGKTAMEIGFEENPVYYDIFINSKTKNYKNSDDQKTLVHFFVEKKNEKALEKCVEKNFPLSEKDFYGKTPLDYAFLDINSEGMIDIAAMLIMNGAERTKSDAYEYFQTAVSNRNLNYRFNDGQTPLHLSAIAGHDKITAFLLENNASTNVQDSSGATPLHEAVRYGNTNIAKMLLDSGANINAKDNLGKTPILITMPAEKRDELYSLLIAYKADASKKDTYGDTVLHTATLTKVPVSILEKLILAGADINARNKDGVTPFSIAIESGNKEHIAFYAKKGADINSKDTKGKTPLLHALEKDDETLSLILTSENINSHDSNGNSPLCVAIKNDAPLSKIQYILSLTDDVNSRNSEGDTALFMAVQKNKKQLGELLLAKNADIFATNNKNQSPLSLALSNGADVMDWLITSQTIKATDGSGNTALHYAAEWELSDAVSKLIQKGADSEAKNANGETPIFCAAKTDNPLVIEELVKNGCKLNVRDNLGSTPLHTAVRWGNAKSAKTLIELGADINAQNVSGKSPLSEAAISGKIEMARLLLNCGANPDSSDTSGRTILMDSIRSKNLEITTLLLEKRANPQIQEISGKNAYHEAAIVGDVAIINLIRNAGGNPLSRDKAGNTPFSISLSQGNDVIQAVLGNDTTIADSDGNTPIHIVVKNNKSSQMLENLLTRGYPFDTRNADGYTPLGIAVENKNASLAKLLLEKGADPFISIDKKGLNPLTMALSNKNNLILEDIVKYAGTKSDIQGNTVLHYAARLADLPTIEKLVSYGLDKEAKNISGETPFTTALRWKRNDAAQLLK